MSSSAQGADQAAGAPDAERRRRARLALLAVGVVLVVVGVANLAGGGLRVIHGTEPIDLDINLVAGQRLIDREPLYDRKESAKEAVEVGGPSMRGGYTWALNGYPSPPSTALFHAPFAPLPHDVGVALFRWLTAIGMAGAVVLTAWSLRPGDRLVGAVVGLGALVSSYATIQTLQLGQGHEFVMLGFALGLWGAARERWTLCGIGFGIATVLKLSPGIIVVYLLLRGKRRAAVSAAITTVALNVLAAALGRPSDFVTWLRDIVPAVSDATLRIINQSLPGLLARATTNRTDLDLHPPLGGWKNLAAVIVVVAVLGLWRVRRHDVDVDPLDLGFLILVALLAGPLTWTHYLSWVALPVVLMADPRRWERRSRVEVVALAAAGVVALLLLTAKVEAPSPATVAADWSTRLSSSPYTIATLVLCGVAVALGIVRRPEPEPADRA